MTEDDEIRRLKLEKKRLELLQHNLKLRLECSQNEIPLCDAEIDLYNKYHNPIYRSGVELDKHYYDLAVKRFEKETAQFDLFGASEKQDYSGLCK